MSLYESGDSTGDISLEKSLARNESTTVSNINYKKFEISYTNSTKYDKLTVNTKKER